MLTPECVTFAIKADSRIEIAASRACNLPIFQQFLDLLESYSGRLPTQEQIAIDFVNISKLEWTVSTAKTNIKIMLDWAKHLRLAPESYQNKKKRADKQKDTPSLFR
jgi:hypothetical protein